MGRKILSVFMAIAVAVSLSACQAEDTGHTSSLSETAVSEPSAQTEDAAQTAETTAPVKPNDYPAYPLPEGWTFEKIINLIEIDGVPLSLEFNDKDFENINNGIEFKSEDFINNFYHDIYYNNELIATLGKYSDKNHFSNLFIGYYYENEEINNTITFASYPLTECKKIYDYLDNHFTISYENENTKSRKYIFKSNNSTLSLDIMYWSEYSPQRLTMNIYIE